MHARMDSLRSDNGRWSVYHRPSWGIVWIFAVVGRCRAGSSDTCDVGKAWVKDSYLYRSQLSHFSSCLTVLTFETPQFALLDAAHGALSEVWWPQLYWCTTLVHILAEIGEAGALHSGERLLRAALRIVEGRRGGG